MVCLFEPLKQKNIPVIVASFTQIGWNKPASIFENYLLEQTDYKRCVWIAWVNDNFVGYVTLKWVSCYQFFAQNNIPEINDLNVLPEFRNQGIGSQLLALAEAEAKKKCSYVGLGVGLSADYGPAQKLYIKRGYIPDGNGITYHDALVNYGDEVRLDDDLILWLTKKCLK